jgi:hypothetical protein
MIAEPIYNEGDSVHITDPLTRTLYGTRGTIVAVVRLGGRPTTLEIQLDDAISSERLIVLRADEVAPA